MCRKSFFAEFVGEKVFGRILAAGLLAGSCLAVRDEKPTVGNFFAQKMNLMQKSEVFPKDNNNLGHL